MSLPAPATSRFAPLGAAPPWWHRTSRRRISKPAAARPRAEGVELEWREADAEALPFKNGEFDVVTSCCGAMFAPDHRAVADELLRVCRPGGTIGMINFTPRGAARDFFDVLGHYAPPPPPGARPPLLWGDEDHVRALFGNRIASLDMTRREYVETAASPREYYELFQQTFGPMVAIRASLADQPDRLAALERDFLAFVTRSNRATTDRVEIPYEVPAGRRPQAASGLTRVQGCDRIAP